MTAHRPSLAIEPRRTIDRVARRLAIPALVFLLASSFAFVGGTLLHAGAGAAPPPSVRPAGNSSVLTLSASATPTSGVAPLTVAFSAVPFGGTAPYRVGFNFGDGSSPLVLNNSGNGTANQVNHTYASPGNFTPYLWVNDSVGGSNSTTLSLTVTSGSTGGNGSGRVTILATPSTGSSPLNVTLTARVSGNGTPTGYNWTFGDGGTGSGNPVNHLYTAAGSFGVGVQVSGLVAGRVVGANTTVVVTNGSSHGSGNGSGLQANATVTPASGGAPLPVTFTAAPSGGAAPYQVHWNFGDGTYSGLRTIPGSPQIDSVQHNYTSVGAYYPSISVNDSAGHRVSQGFGVLVTRGNGTPQLTVAASTHSGRAPLTVTLWANVSGNATPTGYRWQFGDGGNGTGTPITHVYGGAGTYRAVVNVSGVLANASLVGNTTITVTNGTGAGSGNGSLQIGLHATPISGSAPLNVTVVANVTGGTAPYQLSYCTYIGNGSCNFTRLAVNVSAGSPVTFHLTENVTGTVTVLVRAVDASFNSTLATVGIVVGGGGPLTARISLNTTAGPEPLAVGLNVSVTGGTSPYTIQWFFGDGSVGSSLSGGVVSHLYESGHFWPVLRVTDSAGHALIRVAPHDIVVTDNGTRGCALPLVSSPAGGLGTALSGLPVSVLLAVVAAGGLGAGLAVSAVGYRRLHQRLERAEGETLALTMEGPLRPPAG